MTYDFYRSLGLLKRHGLIDELDLMHLEGEAHYYEHKLNRDHIHTACLRCGRITGFVSNLFESFKEQIEKDCAYRIVVARLEIGGSAPGTASNDNQLLRLNNEPDCQDALILLR